MDAASVIGADAIKFQTFRAEHLAVPDARKADYQIENTGQTMSQYEMLKKTWNYPGRSLKSCFSTVLSGTFGSCPLLLMRKAFFFLTGLGLIS